MMYDILSHTIEVAELIGFGLICYWFGTFVATHELQRDRNETAPVIESEIEAIPAEVIETAIVVAKPVAPMPFDEAEESDEILELDQFAQILTAHIELVWLNEKRWMQVVFEQVAPVVLYQMIQPQALIQAAAQPVALLSDGAIDTIETIAVEAVTVVETDEPIAEDTDSAIAATKECLHDMTIRDLKAIAKALTDTLFKITRYSRLNQDELITAMTHDAGRLEYLATLDLKEVAEANRSAAKTKSKPASTTVNSSTPSKRQGGRSKASKQK